MQLASESIIGILKFQHWQLNSFEEPNMQALFLSLICQVLTQADRALPAACPQPPKLSLEVNETVVEQFEPITFEWQSYYADACASTGDWVGSRALQGKLTTTFQTVGEKEVVFECSGSGGLIKRAVQFTVLDSPIETGETRLENGASFFSDKESNSLFHIPVLNHYSLRRNEGTFYPNSSTGEIIEIEPGFYEDKIINCSIADLNGDEFPDVVATSTSTWYANEYSKEGDIKNPEKRPRVHLLLNSGDGFFEAAPQLLEGTAHYRIYSFKDIEIADLNNDGLDDILVSSDGGGAELSRDDGITILMSQADGSYAEATQKLDFPLTSVDRGDYQEDVLQITAGAILAADINADGLKDIFIVGSSSNASSNAVPTVFLNSGDESFEPWDLFTSGRGDIWTLNDWSAFRGGEVVDFDLDGDDDIVLLCYRECFYPSSPLAGGSQGNGLVLLNERGVFDPKNAINFPIGLFGSNTKNDAIDVGDVNGDGYPDIVTSSGKSEPYYVNRKIQVLINQQGTALLDETNVRIENPRTDANGHAEGLTFLVDFDHDGDLDIFDFQAGVREGVSNWAMEFGEQERAFPYFSNGGAVFVNNGTGDFTPLGEDLHDAAGLKAIDWPSTNQASYSLQNLYAPYNICPVDFGGEFGVGFLYATFSWTGVLDDPEDGDVNSIATVRQLRASDQSLLETE